MKMKPKIQRFVGFHQLLATILVFSVSPGWGKTKVVRRTQTPEVLNVASPDRIDHSVRPRPLPGAGVCEPLHKSSYPAFYETAITSDDAKQKHTNDVFITDDGRCFVMGNVFALERRLERGDHPMRA